MNDQNANLHDKSVFSTDDYRKHSGNYLTQLINNKSIE